MLALPCQVLTNVGRDRGRGEGVFSPRERKRKPTEQVPWAFEDSQISRLSGYRYCPTSTRAYFSSVSPFSFSICVMLPLNFCALKKSWSSSVFSLKNALSLPSAIFLAISSGLPVALASS